jgi:hypothetical protein
MHRLVEDLGEFCRDLAQIRGIQVRFDGPDTPGEAEHKLIGGIRGIGGMCAKSAK